jgi:hypothetical protein
MAGSQIKIRISLCNTSLTGSGDWLDWSSGGWKVSFGHGQPVAGGWGRVGGAEASSGPVHAGIGTRVDIGERQKAEKHPHGFCPRPNSTALCRTHSARGYWAAPPGPAPLKPVPTRVSGEIWRRFGGSVRLTSPHAYKPSIVSYGRTTELSLFLGALDLSKQGDTQIKYFFFFL